MRNHDLVSDGFPRSNRSQPCAALLGLARYRIWLIVQARPHLSSDEHIGVNHGP
jgi:hypothetical protein